MVRDKDALKRTAIHESGHVLVASLTPGAHPVGKATIIPRGRALGFTSQVAQQALTRPARCWCMGALHGSVAGFTSQGSRWLSQDTPVTGA